VVREHRPWSEVAIAGTALQSAAPNPRHIGRGQLAALVFVALVFHASVAWYFERQRAQRTLEPHTSELSIELVHPPSPPELPKVPPQPPPPSKPQPQRVQALPQIQQAEPEPGEVGAAIEAPIAVAPIVSESVPAPLPVTAPVGRAGYLNNPPPTYPAIAVRQGWQGTVLLRVRVLSTGKVESVEIKQSGGRKLLDDEAIRTVKLWLFTPSKQGEAAIDGWATVPIEFSLEQ